MPQTEKSRKKNQAGAVRIILPTLLAVVLFVISIFAIIIPSFRSNMMERKRELIRELTNSAWSVMQEYAEEEKKGTLSHEEAQKRAISDIRYLRYGEERKDYFWITDTRPYMVMHPYNPQLEGQDLSGPQGQDPTGKKLFVEMVRLCEKNGHGYVEYMWQWKDNPDSIVPKLSYVKAFKPWGWIIGTGIYLEDVKEEIAALTARLIKISIAIIVIMVLLLLYIMQHSLKIEKQRQIAEENLMESERKYRAMVEAATEGTILIRNFQVIYSNKVIHNMLGYTATEFKTLRLDDIFPTGKEDADSGKRAFDIHMEIPEVPAQYETQLRKQNGYFLDVALTASPISLGEEKGTVVMVRDISGHKQIEEELDQSKEKYKTLTNNLDIGVFRTTTGRNGKFIEANNAAVKTLGFSSREELFKITIFDLFHSKEEGMAIFKELIDIGFVRNRLLQLRRPDGTLASISISVVLIKDEKGEDRFLDGIVEDITESKKVEEEREKLIVQLQAAQLFFNSSLKHLTGEMSLCSMNTSIRKAAATMSKHNHSAILVTAEETEKAPEKEAKNGVGNESGKKKGSKSNQVPSYLGIITDRDLRDRVAAEGIDLNRPVYEIMSSPLATIPESALIFEAILLMQEKQIRHLAVKDHNGKVVSIITNEQLLQTQRSSSFFLIKEIHEAEFVEDIITTQNRLPRLVKALIDSGANSKNIGRIITAVADSIVERLIRFALDELGPPPAEFVFVALGSEGREEQTLITDQDNTIIYEDLSDPLEQKKAGAYFLQLAEKVNTWLDKCGYKFCAGDIMAKNPQWCQPLATWKKYFYQWINTANPQDLLEVNIFFDFRCIYGHKVFTEELRDSIDVFLEETPAFLQYFARNALLYKPPIGFFGNIVVESSGENPSTFDIKEAMKTIVNFARIYALKNQVRDTNTQDRLYRLYSKDLLNKSSYEEIVQVYDYLMQMRFKHQAQALNENRQPDNFINPKNLTDIEQSLLKQTFSQINNFQKKLSYDFTGTA